MALHLEVRFIDETDFVNKRKGFMTFIVEDNPNWEIDRFLGLADSLYDILSSRLRAGVEVHRKRFC